MLTHKCRLVPTPTPTDISTFRNLLADSWLEHSRKTPIFWSLGIAGGTTDWRKNILRTLIGPRSSSTRLLSIAKPTPAYVLLMLSPLFSKMRGCALASTWRNEFPSETRRAGPPDCLVEKCMDTSLLSILSRRDRDAGRLPESLGPY